MKSAFALVGIILTGILLIVLVINHSPEIMEYKINDPEMQKYLYTKPQLPKMELNIVTSEPDFWDQVKAMNEKNSIKDNEKEKPEPSVHNLKKEKTPVTTVPDNTKKPDAGEDETAESE